MCNCDFLSVAFELLSAPRSSQMSPAGLTFAFPAQHFPATPTDGLFQLITAVPCMVESSRLHTRHRRLCCHSKPRQLNLIKFSDFCIKETVKTKHDKCTGMLNLLVTVWQKNKDKILSTAQSHWIMTWANGMRDFKKTVLILTRRRPML